MSKATARAPYSAARTRKERERQVDDAELDDPTAIELARLEQQLTPPDLANVAA